MELQRDWIDLLSSLNDASAKYLVVGAAAIALHAEPRATRDFDIWIDTSAENAPRVYLALAKFGAPVDNVSVADFEQPDLIFQIGVEPLRIDIITGIDGVTFADAWTRKVDVRIAELVVPFISRQDLISNKRASGRPKDLLDLLLLDETQRGPLI